MRKFFALFLTVLMLSSVLLTGCGGLVFEEGVHYSKQFIDDGFDVISGKEIESVYNKDVFYRNDVTVNTADPFVFRCTDATDTVNYGTYFLYGTTTMGVFNCYSSLDLVTWKPKSGAYIWNPNGWQYNTCWAPEVIWDEYANPSDYNLEDDGLGKGVYFLFASSDAWQDYNKGGGLNRVLDMAVSVSPYGPFYQWRGVEKGAVINCVDYGKEANYATKTKYAESYSIDPENYKGYVGRENDEVTIDDPWWNAPAAMASLTYQWQNKSLAGQVGADGKTVNPNAKYLISDEGSGWFDCIDPHPYLNYNEMIDVDGVMQPKKYLFFTRRQGSDNAMAIDSTGKLVFLGSTVYACTFIDNDWAQIDYNSLSRISGTNYNFISQLAADAYKEQAQAFNASNYPLGYKEVADDGTILNEYASFTYGFSTTEMYVDSSNGINEGAQLWYNKDTGLYYLSISISAYTSSSYSVITLVAYDIMGPYRKLELEEGGLTLGANGGLSMDNVTGPGHHTIFKCGDELLMMYHKHRDLNVSIYTRGYCVDRIQWVKNQAGMTVMHVNGPTTSIQPKFIGTGTTPYTNITSDAEVSVNGDYNDVKYLSDNIIPIHNYFVSPHVYEFEFTSDEVEITLKFDDYRQVKAIMIYNSREYENSFLEIEEIEFKAKIDGKKGTIKIKNLEFYWDLCQFATGDSLRPGGAATAIFDEISVKEIKITVLNPNLAISGITAISEIYVLGRPNA